MNDTKENSDSFFSLFAIATGIGNKALGHLRLSDDQSKRRLGFEYDFWAHHFELDNMILESLALTQFTQQDQAASEEALRATTHLILLGVSILIHMKSFERALQTRCRDSLVTENRQRYEKAAVEIGEVLQHRSTFFRLQVRSDYGASLFTQLSPFMVGEVTDILSWEYLVEEM